MAYTEDIAALNPNRHFTFDGSYIDEVLPETATNSGCIVTGSPICEDATNCMTTNGVADTVALAANTAIDDELHRKAVGGWFMATAIQQPLTRIYGEGDATNGFTFHLGFGNNLTFEVDCGTFTLQIYADVPLEVDREYHLLMKFESNTYADEFSAYLDGVKQLVSSDVTPGAALVARPVATFGSSATIGMGGTSIKVVSPVNGNYNHWAMWNAADAVALTTTIIREELFEKGALPHYDVTSQANLDSIADTLRPNKPLCIEVASGVTTLSADNVTFDPLASCHVRYMGTGTLNWTNTNGSNASIGSTPNGGTINFINPYTLELTNLKNNSEVRVFDAGTTTEVAGQELVTTGTFSDTIDVTAVDIRIVSLDYKITTFYNVAISSNTAIDVQQFFDRNYKND